MALKTFINPNFRDIIAGKVASKLPPAGKKYSLDQFRKRLRAMVHANAKSGHDEISELLNEIFLNDELLKSFRKFVGKNMEHYFNHGAYQEVELVSSDDYYESTEEFVIEMLKLFLKRDSKLKFKDSKVLKKQKKKKKKTPIKIQRKKKRKNR